MFEREVAHMGHDAWNDVTPGGFNGFATLVYHGFDAAMVLTHFDNLDLEAVAKTAKELRRYNSRRKHSYSKRSRRSVDYLKSVSRWLKLGIDGSSRAQFRAQFHAAQAFRKRAGRLQDDTEARQNTPSRRDRPQIGVRC